MPGSGDDVDGQATAVHDVSDGRARAWCRCVPCCRPTSADQLASEGSRRWQQSAEAPRRGGVQPYRSAIRVLRPQIPFLNKPSHMHFQVTHLEREGQGYSCTGLEAGSDVEQVRVEEERYLLVGVGAVRLARASTAKRAASAGGR